MSAWLSPSIVINHIFKIKCQDSQGHTCDHNNGLFDDLKLLPIFMSLIGGHKNAIKPFDCVGTFTEGKIAVELSLYRYTLDYEAKNKNKARNDSDIKCIENSESLFVLPPVLDELCKYLSIKSDMYILDSSSNENPSTAEMIVETENKIIEKWSLL